MSRLHEANQASIGDGGDLASSSSSSSGSDSGASGSKVEASRIRAAISSIDPVKDFGRIGSMPCARSSLLMGMATAAGVTGISLVAGRGLRRGLNWGVGSFCFVSLASWEICRRNIKAQQMRMRTVIESYRKGQGSRANQPSLTQKAHQQEQHYAANTGLQAQEYAQESSAST